MSLFIILPNVYQLLIPAIQKVLLISMNLLHHERPTTSEVQTQLFLGSFTLLVIAKPQHMVTNPFKVEVLLPKLESESFIRLCMYKYNISQPTLSKDIYVYRDST